MTYNTDVTRTFKVQFNDGTIEEIESHAFPWIYREWFVIQTTAGEKQYHPVGNVVRYTEVAA